MLVKKEEDNLFGLFFSIITILYVPLILYIGLRLWQTTKHYVPMARKGVYWGLIILISLSFPLSRSLGRGLSDKAELALSTIGYFSIVAVIYLFMILIILDIIRLINRFIGKSPVIRNSTPQTGLAALILVAVIILYGSWNAGFPRLTSYDIVIQKDAGETKKLHAVMVSDLHLGRTVDNRRLKEMVATINGLEPDIILMPGDIIQDTDIFIEQKMINTLAELKAKQGIYMSLGNHEYYGGSVKGTVDILKTAGIQVLQEKYVRTEGGFYIIGRDDPAATRSGSSRRKGLSEVMEGIDKNSPIILLNHQPIELNDAQKQGVDLQVSGHTHKGQIFPANLITSRIFEKDWGYLQKGTFQLIVTCGYGTWGPPLRIGNTPEIVSINITFDS